MVKKHGRKYKLNKSIYSYVKKTLTKERIIIIVLSAIILSLLIHSTIIFIELELTKGCIGFMLDLLSRLQSDFEPTEDDVWGTIGCGIILESIKDDYVMWKDEQK